MCMSANPTAGSWSTHGLPSANVTALAVANGYLYVGTDNGLVRIQSRSCIHEEARCSCFFALLFAPALLLADAGILIPRDKAQPDPAILSLEEMEITVRIDNGDARVFVRQIFANHTEQDRRRELHLRAAQPGHGFRLRRMGWAHAHSRGGSRTQAGRGDLHPAQTAGD